MKEYERLCGAACILARLGTSLSCTGARTLKKTVFMHKFTFYFFCFMIDGFSSAEAERASYARDKPFFNKQKIIKIVSKF